MRTQWTAKGNRDAGSTCLCDRGLHRYLRNFGGGGTPQTPPSRYATALITCTFPRLSPIILPFTPRSSTPKEPFPFVVSCQNCAHSSHLSHEQFQAASEWETWQRVTSKQAVPTQQCCIFWKQSWP